MEKKENKVVKFIKDHETEILVLGGGMILGGIAGKIVGELIGRSINKRLPDITPRPELPTGEWEQLFRVTSGSHKGCVDGVVNGIAANDLGKFGELLSSIDGLDETATVDLIFASGTAKNST